MIIRESTQLEAFAQLGIVLAREGDIKLFWRGEPGSIVDLLFLSSIFLTGYDLVRLPGINPPRSTGNF